MVPVSSVVKDWPVSTEPALETGDQLVADAAPTAHQVLAPLVRLAQLLAMDFLGALELPAFEDHRVELSHGRLQLRQLRQP